METNTTNVTPSGNKSTLTHGLLIGIMVLQIAILVGLYRNYQQQRDASSRVKIPIETRLTAPAVTAHPTVHGASMTPASTSGRNPFLHETSHSTPLPSPIARALEMHNEMNRMMQRMSSHFDEMENSLAFDTGWSSLLASPTMDMREQGDHYVLDFSLPGIDASEIQVALEGRLLTVYTRVNEQAPNRRSLSRFERRILLPGPVEGADSAQAVVTNGVLKITIPKARAGGTGLQKIPAETH